MATAIGAYATLAPAKLRLEITDATDDVLLQSLCDRINGWIESTTGRVLAPIPVVNTTVVSGGGAGSTSVTLGTAAGLAIGDAIMFGPISGTHEHGIVVSVAGAVVGLQWPLVDTYAGGTVVTRALIFDGSDSLERGRLLIQPNGIISATDLEVAFYTGGTFVSIPKTDWFLRPLPFDREPGWPATELWMTDIPSSNNPSPNFFRGIGNVRLSGVVTGWPAIPDEITDIAISAVVGAYRSRATGGADAVVVGPDGERTINRLLTTEQWRTLRRYRSAEVVLV